MDNMQYWDALKRPPESALKKITGGRLSGMTDIKPQWRYEIMTKTFGPCGVGWKVTIDKLWTEPGHAEQVMAFALISVHYRTLDGQWSEPTPGIGGSTLVVKETGGLHTNDEGFKMAVTDALSVAMKLLGVGADVYNGYWDGSKYKDATSAGTTQAAASPATAPPIPQTALPKPSPPAVPSNAQPGPVISEAQAKRLYAIAKSAGKSDEDIHACIKLWGYEHSRDIRRSDYEAVCKSMEYVQPREPGEETVPF